MLDGVIKIFYVIILIWFLSMIINFDYVWDNYVVNPYESLKSISFLNNKECLNYIEEILPEKVIILERRTDGVVYMYDRYWEDGVIISEEERFLTFRYGMYEGENKNHLYSKENMIYDKQNINDDGTIGARTYIVLSDIVLKVSEEPWKTPSFGDGTIIETDPKNHAYFIDFNIETCKI